MNCMIMICYDLRPELNEISTYIRVPRCSETLDPCSLYPPRVTNHNSKYALYLAVSLPPVNVVNAIISLFTISSKTL